MLQDANGPDIPSADSDADPGATVLPISWLAQPPNSQLCWAACCAMIMTANGTPTNVEGAAALVLGDPPGDNPEKPGDTLTDVGLDWKQKPNGVGAPLSENSLRQWIVDGRRPVEVLWIYTDGSGTGHVALVTGYDPDGDGSWRVLDPLQDRGWVSYDYLTSYNGQARWDNTFYAIGGAL